MLGKIQRLTRDQFPTLRTSKRVFGTYFSLSYSKNTLTYSRYSVVLSAKSIKTSVRRHAVRRMVYDVVKDRKDTGKNGFDIVFSAKNPFPLGKKDHMVADIQKLLTMVL